MLSTEQLLKFTAVMKAFLLICNCFFLWTKNVQCFKYKNEVTGRVEHLENRIAGGKSVSLDRFPFNVQFFNLGGMCGGSILTKKTVLTAAHCFESNKDVAEMKVFSKSRFVYDTNSFTHGVWSFIIHEKYNVNISYAYDIAVIIIVHEFVISNLVQIVSLCKSEVWMNENETFFVSGWGETEYGGGVANQQLRMTYLNYVSKRRCERENGVKLTSDMFCLYGDGERDTCRGDSGGAVVWQNMLVGIVSHGIGCTKKPSIYVNVSRLLPWLQKVVHLLYKKFCSENARYSNL